MKLFKKLALSLFVLALALPAIAQTNTIVQTSLAAAVTATQNFVTVSSITSFKTLWVLDVDGEQMTISAQWNGTSTTVPVSRYQAKVASHASGAMVLAGRANWFQTYDPYGSCVTANTFTTPWVNLKGGQSGLQWLCSTITLQWIPGFGNPSAPQQVNLAVASAAGKVTPSGPLFHITGTAAITGFNIPVGFYAGTFCAIPDGAFTTTTANNIAIASTGVVNKLLCWTWDATNSKFIPTY